MKKIVHLCVYTSLSIAVFFIIINTSLFSLAVAPTPLGYWPLNEGTGTTTADLSGNGRTGTLVNGPTWTTGKISNALSFDGINDYVSIPDFNPPTNLTLEAWVYPTEAVGSSGDDIIVNKNNSEYDLRILGGSGNFLAGAGSTFISDPTFNFFAPANLNQWYHLVYTFDNPSNTHKLYRNGVLVSTGTNTSNITNTSTALWIGRHSQYNFGTFKGKIDNVRIYDRALNATEVLSRFTE